ncbi:rod shape-determining protein RodA [Falsigemmobacter intermedius]|uniref:Peptidoglycan glycosyltransferase MrdB n=1 Tax=Falsigemmobacter intermedius TaxID=1553448 RepID=A0A3S3UEG5_9RHOB|nr:rod shape-determining protein RodA [Falsigemmobacter intermedius]RWY40017.1 rod shape-determining protein RodA [Falsigemmobacter intermedius]
MSYLDYSVKRAPTGLRKFLHMNWALALLLGSIGSIGVLMLYSVAGGDFSTWAEPQMERLIIGLIAMILMGLVPIWFWRNMAGLAYGGTFLLLVGVELFGTVGMGAQRWIEIGPLRLQPSELMKIALAMMLAAYYDWLDPKKVSRPLWVLVPVLIILLPVSLVLRQPDLGTSLMLLGGGAAIMLVAGVHWAYFAAVLAMIGGAVSSVFIARGTPWQFLQDYQYRRIDTFLDPSADPLGAGYHINQAKIAIGSGGWAGKGFMEGTQSRLNFLPEKHTDFIFNILAEEFGFVGGVSLLVLYALVIIFCIWTAIQAKDRFASLVVIGISAAFFFYFAVNLAMVMGIAPVVGKPLPLVSYGGSAMLVVLMGFGLVQSAHVHRLR